MHPMLNIGIRAARAAGKVITQNVDRFDPMSIEKKQRNDYVTEIDRKAEAEIVGTLRRSYPDHAFLCEESGLIGEETAEFRWIIDPLDGTTNFIHGLPHFSVSIALMQKGRLFQAVIYDPMRQELFTAGKGDGAFLDSKRLRVSSIRLLENALLGSGFPYRDGQDLDFYQRTSRHFTERSGGVRRLGSAALDLAYVAAGRLDGCWLTGLKSWDMAAGGLIVREAGGLVNDFTGGDNWLDDGEVIAASPKVHHQMLEIMKPLSAARHSSVTRHQDST
ncbi:MAG: inositol monophosphatase [Granulosicoccus sp.]|nr:inositol monophosphatase [Granulosicoccus sp.]